MSLFARVDWSSNGPESRQLEGAVWINHVAVSADARIDNAAELRSTLKVGRDTSIPELLVRAYLEWDDQLCQRIAGDFAFVIWDESRRRLLAARDPFGVRPLFYRFGNDRIWFSNRLRRLVDTFGGMPALDDQRVVEYLLGTYAAPERTFFRDIREVSAGSFLIASSSGAVSQHYWAPRIEPSGRRSPPIEYGLEFQRLFLQAVHRRLISSGPVMIHVSGGLDSSAIACAADILKRDSGLSIPSLRGVSGQYPGLDCDESTYINAVAQRVGFPIESWDETRLDVADIVDPGLEEPGIRTIFRGGTMGDVAIARTNGASVILSGLGGDQLGTVEGYIKDLISNGKWREAIDELMFFPKANTRSRIRRLTRLTQQFAPAWLLQMRTKMRRRFPKWLTGEMRSLAAELAPPEVPPISGVSNVQRYTWKRLMSVETLRNVSMMNVHASLHEMEYRFPFLDKDLILFSLSIPYEAWPRPGAYARLHREALADLLPTEISERMGKAEFTSALVNKVRRASRSIMALFGTDWASGRYLDREQALSFCRGVLDGGIVGSVAWRQVWAMATLEAWLRGILAYDAAEKGN